MKLHKLVSKNKIPLLILFIGILLVVVSYGSKLVQGFDSSTPYDIVIIAGQSNAVGNGLDYFKPHYQGMSRDQIDEPNYNNANFQNDKNNKSSPSPSDSVRNNIFMLDGSTVRVAKDPITQFSQSIRNSAHGFGIPFARQYIKEGKNNGNKVMLLGCAMGSTAYSYYGPAKGGNSDSRHTFGWQEGDSSNSVCNSSNQCSLYKLAKQRIDTLANAVPANSRVVAILWHQGENDAEHVSGHEQNYKTGVTTMLKDLRSYAMTKFPSSTTNFPILMGGLCKQEADYYNIMVPIIKDAVNQNSGANFRFVPSDDSLKNSVSTFGSELRPNGRQSFGGKVHFSIMGQIELGYRYFYVFNNNSINLH